jgi:large subunit ribosomal protein L9
MDAILLKDVDGLGGAGTVVSVTRGYMRNYLQPRGMAETATESRVAEIRRLEDRRRASEVRQQQMAAEQSDLLGRTILTLKAKAGDDGRLFGSITAGDVSDAIHEARGIRIDKRHIHVDPPIRAVGTYVVPVELTPDLIAEVKTIVSPLLD